MPMTHALTFATDDGFSTSILELEDQSLRVTVTRGERSWTGDRSTIQEAVALAARIRAEKGESSGGERDPDMSTG